MAMYYQGGSEMQGDGLQTLYLMNPNYIGFSDNPLPPPPPQEQLQPPSAASMMFLNSAHALHPGGVSHARIPQSQHFVGVPLPAQHHDPNRSLWTAVDQPPSAGTADFASQLGFHHRSAAHQQGLSLSLSPQHQHQPFASMPVESPVGLLSARLAPDNHIRDPGCAPPSSAIMGSRYLKAAQELLHEVVNAEKIIKSDAAAGVDAGNRERARMNREPASTFSGEPATDLTTAQRQELQVKKAKLLSMLDEVEQRDRQYIQQMQMMAATFEEAAGVGSAKSYTLLALKTISKQFRCLKAAIGSQIKAAGKRLGEEEGLLLGGGPLSSSSSRLLKFADHHHQQQHRALQQHFGMMQPNAAWRPQRGLPERAVSVLRAWLFEHFLHPYPKDSDKIMLAKQTGLTRSQVSNWFINARVRLWKPMVEEMYTEEMKGQEKQQHGSKEETNNKGTKRNEGGGGGSGSGRSPTEKPMTDSNNSPTADNISSTSLHPQQCGGGGAFSFINTLNMENNNHNSGDDMVIRNCGKKPRNDTQSSPRSSIVSVDMDDMKSPPSTGGGGGYNNKFAVDRPVTGNFPDLLAAAASTSGFGGFPIGDFGRPFSPENLAAPGFHGGHNNGSVSLTLGLPPSENQQNYLSTHEDIELGRRLEMGRMGIDNHNNNHQPPASHSSINGGYESIDFESAGKRFAAQLLPDFVA